MKKLFVMAALVGVALTGCMKNEVYVPTCDTPISFEVANYEAQTRANGAFEYDSFGVNAWSRDAAASESVLMMDGEIVEYVDDKWTTETPYYWPINGTVDFIAYYPANEEPDIIYDYAGGDTYTYSNYTVEDVDLMYADKAIRFSANTAASDNKTGFSIGSYGFEGVPTLFHHALAKVNFKVKNANPYETDNPAITYEIVVNNITLKTYNTGSVTLKNTGTGTASRGSWSVVDPEDEGNVWAPKLDSNLETLTWANANLVLADNSVKDYATRTQYVLPQTLTDDVTVSVTYTVTQKQNGTPISVKQYTPAAIKLNTMGLESWEMNKNITYTISISAQSNQILFAPAVENWENVADVEVTIQ